MATRNFVPRFTGEGSLGTSERHWGALYADNVHIKGELEGNASTASNLKTARVITVSGDANGSVLFDGSSNVTLKVKLDEDVPLGLQEMTYEAWSALSDEEKIAAGDVIVTDYPITYSTDSLQNSITSINSSITSINSSITSINSSITSINSNISSIESILGDLLTRNGTGTHNGIYRGKNIGTALTSKQVAAIADQTFDDMYIGDYWTINGINWRIAAFNYWLGCGDTEECTTPHVVVVPDISLYTAQMNTSNTTSGGYASSAMRNGNIATAGTTINNAFGSSHLLNHRIVISNATNNGAVTGAVWTDSTFDLMEENQVYGHGQFADRSGSCHYTINTSIFPLFFFNPQYILARNSEGVRAWYWLSDVKDSACFANVNANGRADYAGASDAGGVRPAFGIF